MKIAIVCTQGGHLTESLQLVDAFTEHEYFIVTHYSMRDDEIKKIARTYFCEGIEASFIKMLKTFIFSFSVLRNERPDVVISLGAEIAVPFIYLAKIFRIKTIFIESWCRTSSISVAGKLVYPIVDEFWVQWPELEKIAGKKAKYKGSVI